MVEGFSVRAALFPVQQTRDRVRRPRVVAGARRHANQAHFLRLQALRRVGERARCLMACSLLCLLEAQAG